MQADSLRNPALLAAGQYADGANLRARSALHDRFSTAPAPFRVWEAGLIKWADVTDVLDVGCGTGRFWENPALPRTLTVTLVDVSPGMVREATAVATAAGFTAAQGQVADAQALPFADGAFDVVIANHMLYHVPDPSRAVAEFRRVLRPGGTALIATNASGHMAQLNDLVAQVMGPYDIGLNEVFGIEVGEGVLRRHFSTLAWHSFVNPLMVTDAQAVVDYATSIEPGAGATPHERDLLLHRTQERVIAGGGAMRIETRTGAFVAAGLPR